jgi:4-amino-4-deoxy-L-arabinose transferase-like glycosyltransferase
MPWLPLVLALGAAGLVCLIWSVARSAPRAALAGFVCLMAAMLVTPGVWSALTTVNSSDNQSLPSAYSGRASGPSNRGDLSVNQDLLDYLQARTRDYKYLMAVPSSMQGADYVLATGRPVLYMGGFMGQDQVVNGDDLARMVANKELRFIYWGVREAFGGQSSVSSWVSANCKAVQGFETTARNAGAPDGTSGGAQGVSNSSSMRVSLYDCAPE